MDRFEADQRRIVSDLIQKYSGARGMKNRLLLGAITASVRGIQSAQGVSSKLKSPMFLPIRHAIIDMTGLILPILDRNIERRSKEFKEAKRAFDWLNMPDNE